MLRIELAALSAQELRRLHDAARNRGQTALAEQLAAELAARPVRVDDWTPRPIGYGAQLAFEGPEEPAARRRSGVMMTTAALAAFVSAAVTWGISVPVALPGSADRAPPAPPRAAIVLASLAPVGPQPAYSPPPAVDPSPQPTPQAPVRIAHASSSPGKAANPCLALPTAAERLVCGYPSLAAQDRVLRTAYDSALAKGADRRELDRTQAAWRAETENVSDRQALAEHYQRRIRELQSAPAKPPPEEPLY